MKNRVFAGCAAVGIALAAFGAPTAGADTAHGTLAFSPAIAKPGDWVDISATCDDPDYKPNELVSGVFRPVLLAGAPDDKGVWQLSGKTQVSPNAPKGVWPAAFVCGGTRVEANLEVGSPYPSVAVKPEQGRPGERVTVIVSCTEAIVTHSTAIAIGKFEKLPNADLFAAVSVVANVRPGTYDVNTTCGTTPTSTKFTVLAAAPPPATKNNIPAPAKPQNPAPAKPQNNAQVPVKPKGPADTGSLDAAPVRRA